MASNPILMATTCVLKFGGTSVADAAVITRVKDIVLGTDADRKVVVVSAMGGITDLLLQAAEQAASKNESYSTLSESIEKRHLEALEELLSESFKERCSNKIKAFLSELETLLHGALLTGELTPKLQDKIVSLGELMSATLISAYFESQGISTSYMDSRELIRTDATFDITQVDHDTTRSNCLQYIKGNTAEVLVLPGFIASDSNGETTTLGRGGSDFSAAILAASLDADELQIWTDVSGMFTANPKWVRQARSIPRLSYQEAMELSHFGAKVLYPPTIQPVLQRKIPIVIKNTFEPEAAGTRIEARNGENGRTVRGISHIPNIALLLLEGPGMIGVPGTSKRFFEELSSAGINIVMITQASSEHSICVGVNAQDAKRAATRVNKTFEFEIGRRKINPVQIESDLAIIALVGDQMKQHQGLSGRMFSALGRNNVNIRAIAQGASERNISAVIDKEDVKKALNTLHEAFFEVQTRQLNLFVVGVGNVGSKFLEQIRSQSQYLIDELRIRIRVIGISNSRTMVFDEQGLDLKSWETRLAEGEAANLDRFFQRTKDLNLRNSILVDNTASETVAATYSNYLRNSIAVVTCNKIACSAELEHYKSLKRLSREYDAPFLYETNVGAGLPIIDTLKNLIASGDEVRRIEAVLSGSLNFIFNHYDSDNNFHDIVKRAHEEGYTEPDPRIDLSGMDVMRKILILARESGYDLSMEAIENQGFLPKESMEAPDVDAFFETLKTHESAFQNLLREAKEKNSSLKYVAVFEDGKARVGLQQIPEGHSFDGLRGSDNIVLFYTKRYPEQPLLVKGAGAGADVTASGLFADIIRIGNF